MSNRNPASLPELMLDLWMLAGEASIVVGLRSLRMMGGGPVAQREGQRMISEKIAVNMTLWSAVMAGGIHQSPEAAGKRVVAHYRTPVRANRRRLSR